MRITLCEIWAEGGATHAKERELDLEDGVIAEEAPLRPVESWRQEKDYLFSAVGRT